ncbi:MAG: hypothetical protein NPINA01_01250 [Nitrospinaceae bacterium]|nr:MAG: hypothetical protein NPINA01_01250 [Nitrospinaceae bacterium]
MKIVVNGVENTLSFTGETLGEVLDHILAKKPSKGNYFSKIRLNDKDVPFDSETIRETPVSQIETLETEISSLDEILKKNITNAQDYLQKLIPGIQKAADLFRSGSEQEANKFFLNIIDGMDWFSQVTGSIAQAVGLKAETALWGGKSFPALQENLVEWTQQMVEANKNKDWVLLADLLEYEILPFYREWEEHLPKILSDRTKKSH